jgi:hypothetical protein
MMYFFIIMNILKLAVFLQCRKEQHRILLIVLINQAALGLSVGFSEVCLSDS